MGQTLIEASSPDVEENEQGLLDQLWICDHECLLKGDNHLWSVRICRRGTEACQRELTGDLRRGVHPGAWSSRHVWTSFPERPSPNMVLTRVPSLQLGSSEFSGRHVCIQRIVYHCDKGNGRGFAAGALAVERRVMCNFPLHQT